jgi:hypothetical protein
VAADETHGRDDKFRAWLEQRRVGYAVVLAAAVPVSDPRFRQVQLPVDQRAASAGGG